MSTKAWYLAGPMSGVPQFNIPLFEKAAAALRSQGYSIISPAELDSPEIRKEALASPDGKLAPSGKIGGETWGQILARDVRVVADDVEGIILLPNWPKSRGVKLETFVGLLTQKRFAIYEVDVDQVKYVSADYVRGVLKENMP